MHGMTLPGRAFVLGAVDLCLAGAVAIVFWANVGIAGGSDTNPPTCTTSTGHSVDCSLETPLRVAQAALFIAVLAALVTWQVVRGRRRARVEAVGRG
jgi:hypothetical protein